MLYNREFGQDFGNVHLDHAFIDFGPASSNAGDVVEHGRMLPEGALLDIIDEADGREIQILSTLLTDSCHFGHFCRVGCVS